MRVLPLLAVAACHPGPTPDLDVYGQAHTCSAVRSGSTYLTSTGGDVAFTTRSPDDATAFRMQPADLATYLLYDPDGGYVVSDEDSLVRRTELESDMTRTEDDYVSGALWTLTPHPRVGDTYALQSRRTGRWLARDGTTDVARRAAPVTFEGATGCADYPELSLDAEGEITRTTWDDGELYGFADMHSHLFSNYGFGGGMFHGAPFHPLGVTHALGDCDAVHGEMGRTDFFGYVYDAQGNGSDLSEVLPHMISGELPEDNHDHRGYPDFPEWPDAIRRSTHQTQYYRWIQRSYLSGLRLIVQHATTNSVVCTITVGEGWAPSRYDCEDMTAVDRQLDAAYEMERYIDAQSGGPGRGWFRVVESPAEAREVIAAGKLAVVLGIEVSDLFDCHLTPRPGGPVCDEAHVDAQLDAYYDRGVRVLFPNHKYDNAFTPGDGSDGFIEVGNFINTGHYTNKVEDCPAGVPSVFDGGAVSFSGLLEPRDVYDSPAPEDFSDLPDDPIDTLLPYALRLLDGPAPGRFCQNGSLTPIGEHLIDGIMDRGMIVEVDHLPAHSFVRTYEMLEEADYPAVGTHGNENNGRVYALGGSSTGGFGRCHDAGNPGGAIAGFLGRVASRVAAGGHPSIGFGFDYNGFAHGPRPRFGPESDCVDQVDPVTYPFTSVDGAITFTEPRAGNRTFDYGTEGMVHIGLIPEYIEDVRRDGATDADLEPLFRSAEGYIRIWEKAVARAAER
jgi:microsomal dipeptidase-like Zn-dependent dipeptidase